MHYIVIVRTDTVPDSDLGHYLANVGDTLARHNGRLLAFGAPSRLEGGVAYTKTAVIEFDSEAAATGWYHSDAYQDLASWRIQTLGHEVDINLVPGLGR
ncbi:uncharacterized protein (DUF1330 family) [Murinocardiopsis flavida]|uniref:Uncharacterized protein (DUF1330 family) n=1 Tax=Murinocardiopsis flavida TaxID=645275 RepID=A0A2P8DNS2_9ACTN|nr:DUF1330 domain-containing protein [Murinocardiopsis flavida]PSK98851.1 uncharacterized protein (DUF1330 family) [Murinocardiopsis flavida]